MSVASTVAMGIWLRELREAREEPLRVVAASVSMDSTLLSKIERGDRLPTVKQTSKLAGYFGIPEEELQAKRIAADFLGRYGAHPAAPRALGMIRESLVDCGCFPSERLSGER